MSKKGNYLKNEENMENVKKDQPLKLAISNLEMVKNRGAWHFRDITRFVPRNIIKNVKKLKSRILENFEIVTFQKDVFGWKRDQECDQGGKYA